MPDVAFDVDASAPQTLAMEAAAAALLDAAREIVVSAITPEIRERISAEETETDFIGRNMVHVATMALANVAGEKNGVGTHQMMEAFGTAVGTCISAQAGGVLHVSCFWASLISTLSDNGLAIVAPPGSMSDFIPGEHPLPEEDDDEGAQ
jgi:hypothetical protein